MTKLSMHLKVMPMSYKGHEFVLVIINPVHQSMSKEIEDALIGHVFSKYSMPECMIMDQYSAFLSALINLFV